MPYLRFVKDNGKTLFVQEQFIISIEPADENGRGYVNTTEGTIAILDLVSDVEEMFLPPEPSFSETIANTPEFPIEDIGDVMNFLGVQKESLMTPETVFNVREIMCTGCSFVVGKKEELTDGLCPNCYHGDSPEGVA